MKKQIDNTPIHLLKLVIEPPKDFISLKLFRTPQDGRVNNLYVQVLSSRIIGFNIYFTLKVLTSNLEIKGVYFRYKPYHIKIFSSGNILNLRGKVKKDGNYGYQLINPHQIKEFSDEVKPIYKDKNIAKAISKNLNYGNLKNLGLPYKVIELLLKLHLYPDDKLIEQFDKFSEFPEDIIYALKYTEAFHYIQGVKNSAVEYPTLQKLDSDITEWIKNLPFQLTDDQQKTISNIQTDMKSNIAMRRVVVGDVGSGKTMVILASIVIAYPFKSVLMAPTSILAKQLFEEAKKYLPEKYNISLLTSKTSKKVDLNYFDVLIGTSAILYREISDVPLIIIDEQHRFGTKDRNRLNELMQKDGKHPHFIQLSATPIPRTQAMINSTFIKTSLIETTPFKKDIETITVFPKDFSKLIERINNEIDKNNQILIIYPLVNESENVNYQSLLEAKDYWENNFDDVYVTHGKDKNKEKVLSNFRDFGSILLSTTVVEVGISLPRLTVIIIVGAERLGLATLHQLRGRVSRTGLKGYCYLFTKSQNSSILSRLENFGRTKSGFDIASLDLENRKSGDIVKGVKQSGDSFQWLNLVTDKNIIKEVLNNTKR